VPLIGFFGLISFGMVVAVGRAAYKRSSRSTRQFRPAVAQESSMEEGALLSSSDTEPIVE